MQCLLLFPSRVLIALDFVCAHPIVSRQKKDAGLPPGLAGFPAAPNLPRDPLAAFLDGAGMGRYLGLFRAEEIRTLEDFRLLTAQDLHNIGLPPHDAAVLHQRTAAHYLANGL